MEAAEGRDSRGKPSSRHEQFGEMLYLMLMASGCPKFLALVDRFGVVTSGRRDATVQGGQRMARFHGTALRVHYGGQGMPV